MATSSFQDLARQQNALRSTGPKTDDGKARSAVNSTKHGFAGSGAVLTPEVAAELAARRAGLPAPAPAWDTASVQVETDWLLAGIRLDLCRDARARLIRDHWELDHQADAEDLARQLPRMPGLVTTQLERGRHGVDWKIARWGFLLDQLEKNGELTRDELRLGYDLVGTPQMERAEEFGPDDAGPLRQIAQYEIDRLRNWRDQVLVPNERYERISAEMGVPDNETKNLRLLRRYERELENKQRRLAQQVAPVNVKALVAHMSAPDTSTRPNGAHERPDMMEVASAMFDVIALGKNASTQAPPHVPDMNKPASSSAPSRDEAGDRSRGTEGSRQEAAMPDPAFAPPPAPSRDEAGAGSCRTEGSRREAAMPDLAFAPPPAPSRDEAGGQSRRREESRRRKERRKREKASRRASRQNR